MKKNFATIKKMYDRFHQDMHSKGRLLVKDTGIGYWGITPTEELFELFQRTKLDKHKKFIDLGSGDGRAALVAGLFTDSTGIEFDEELHNFALNFAKKAKSKVKLLQKDFMQHDLSEFDYLFIHPDRRITDELEIKLADEMRDDAKLVVFGPHSHPESMKQVEKIDVMGSIVGVYKKS